MDSMETENHAGKMLDFLKGQYALEPGQQWVDVSAFVIAVNIDSTADVQMLSTNADEEVVVYSIMLWALTVLRDNYDEEVRPMINMAIKLGMKIL